MTPVIAAMRFALGSGGALVQLPLLVHVGAGVVGVITGFVALSAAKGDGLHRASGRIFLYAMLVMALVGATLAAIEGKGGSVDGGLLTAYFVVTAVVTAVLTVRPRTVASRRMEVGAMVVALSVGLANVALGAASVANGHTTRDGVPVAVYFVMGAIALLSSGGDARTIRGAPLSRSRRLTRHLWRMCFALFIATGSFFLGQAHLIPKPYRVYWLLAIPAFAPLAAMAWWLWRVRKPLRTSGMRYGAAARTA